MEGYIYATKLFTCVAVKENEKIVCSKSVKTVDWGPIGGKTRKMHRTLRVLLGGFGPILSKKVS